MLAAAASAQVGGRPPGTGRPVATARLPFAAGTVSAVDSAGGTLTLAALLGGGPQTVHVAAGTQITALLTVKIGDLKVGDRVQVQGVPTGITAAQITAGDSLDAPPRLPPGAGRSGAGGGRLRPDGPQAAFASASGKITALLPLTIAVSDSVQVTLKAAPDARIRRSTPITLADIKAGDRILANGVPGSDGTLYAAQIRVNFDMGFGTGFEKTPVRRRPGTPGASSAPGL